MVRAGFVWGQSEGGQEVRSSVWRQQCGRQGSSVNLTIGSQKLYDNRLKLKFLSPISLCGDIYVN